MEERFALRHPVVHLAGDFIIQAGFTLGPRTIDDYEIVWFPDASNTIYDNEHGSFSLNEPCFIFTRPGERHSFRFDPDKNVRHLFMHFDYDSLRECDERFEALLQSSGCFWARQYALLPGIMTKLLSIAHHQPPYWKRRLAVLATAALEELASPVEEEALPEAREWPVQIQRAIEYMDKHLAEPIAIEDIAFHCGWSHEHFTRMFVAALGMTPIRMLLEKRIRRAEQWMLQGTGTIKHIAYGVGFLDENHFSRMYKKVRGITATEFIKRSNDPLFRHTADVGEIYTLNPINRYAFVNEYERDEDIK